MDLEKLIDRYRSPLIGLIAAWGAPWGQATELAQDTFAEAFLSQGRFRGDSNDIQQTAAWLRGIAFHLFCAWRRRQGRLANLPEDVSYLPAVSNDHDQLYEAIGRLPSKLSTVIGMVYLQENRIKEVAAMLGVSVKTVESRLYQARKELRRILQETAAATKGSS